MLYFENLDFHHGGQESIGMLPGGKRRRRRRRSRKEEVYTSFG
jgi:hypothetical protein